MPLLHQSWSTGWNRLMVHYEASKCNKPGSNTFCYNTISIQVHQQPSGIGEKIKENAMSHSFLIFSLKESKCGKDKQSKILIKTLH